MKKYANGTWQDVPGSQLSGNMATYQVQDGGALDGDGQVNGQVVDPVALLTPIPQVAVQYPPGFGAYEELRCWAHEQCMAQAQGDPATWRHSSALG
uniref:Uncharacterized protein n=1 Tax=Litorilinea aerophila TaxID=1204385 RepID=A0A540VJ45_9CHLR